MFAMNDRYTKALITILIALTLINADQQASKSVSNGVVLVDQTNLTQALEENNHLILYFFQDDCKYCHQFLQTFTLISKLHVGVAKFTKINLTPQTAHLFEQYSISSTPTVLAFQGKKLFKYRYQPIGSGNIVSVHFFKWVERLYTNLKPYEEQQNNPHQLIVHCDSSDLISFWKDVECSQLWLDIYCGEPNFLGENLVIVQEYGRRVQGWQLQKNGLSQFEPKIRRLIKAYKYKYVTHWNTAVTQQIFAYNVSAFVLLMNNQSLSHHAYKVYENIKKKWYQNSYNYEPTIFAVSDLSLKTYQTLKLKHYLTAYVPYSLKEYYYPILAFIHRGHASGKYVLSLTIQKTQANIQQFINKVNHQLIKGNNVTNQQKLKIWLSQQKDINELAAKGTAEGQRHAQKQNEGLIKISLQQTWKHLLSLQYQSSFFVYVSWRFDYKMQTTQKQLQLWWQSQAKTDFAPRHKYQIFLHLPHVIDLPIHPNLSYQYLPALFFISKDKQIQRFQGITDLQKVKKTINDIYLKQQGQQKTKEQ